MLGFQDKSDYHRARDVLERADYTAAGVDQRVGRPQILAVPAADLPPWLRRTRGLSQADTLFRLFLLGVPVPSDSAQQALAPMSLDTWVKAELLAPPDGDRQVAPLVKLLPVGDLMLGSDRPLLRDDQAKPDFVMAPGITTMQLAHATIRTPAQRTLDLGTGCGALGLMAASHSQQVVATDANPRAVDFARFNADLNGIANVSCRTGDLLDPVAQERFDLIVSNPPFVISPSRRFLFRDAGMRGDEFCHRLIRAVPPFLEEGGYCQLKCNFAHWSGEDWRESLTRWFADLHCDVIVWVENTEAISDYAMTWIVGTESRDVDRVGELYEQWMDYYESQEIEAVSYLLVTLRRRSGRYNRTRIDDTPRHIAGPCAVELLRTFAWQDACGPEAEEAVLLEHHLRLAPDVRIEQRHAMTSAGLQALQTQLHKTGGVEFAMQVEPQVAGLLARCDGSRSVHDLLAEMANVLGEDDPSESPRQVNTIRSLVDRGILVPAETAKD